MPLVDLSGIKWASARVRPLDFGGLLRPTLGAPLQRINRLGNRYAIDVELPPVKEEPDGRLLTAMLELALSNGGSIVFPQPGFKMRPMGAPVVDGPLAAELTAVPMRGLLANSIIRYGQYFSVITAGQRYVYRAAEEAEADATGDVSVPIMTMLRAELEDGDTVELEKPVLEGFIDVPEWMHMPTPFVATRFTITEAA